MAGAFVVAVGATGFGTKDGASLRSLLEALFALRKSAIVGQRPFCRAFITPGYDVPQTAANGIRITQIIITNARSVVTVEDCSAIFQS